MIPQLFRAWNSISTMILRSHRKKNCEQFETSFFRSSSRTVSRGEERYHFPFVQHEETSWFSFSLRNSKSRICLSSPPDKSSKSSPDLHANSFGFVDGRALKPFTPAPTPPTEGQFPSSTIPILRLRFERSTASKLSSDSAHQLLLQALDTRKELARVYETVVGEFVPLPKRREDDVSSGPPLRADDGVLEDPAFSLLREMLRELVEPKRFGDEPQTRRPNSHALNKILHPAHIVTWLSGVLWGGDRSCITGSDGGRACSPGGFCTGPLQFFHRVSEEWLRDSLAVVAAYGL